MSRNFPIVLLIVLALMVATNALRCHQINRGSINDPNAITTSTSLQDCMVGANSCVKTIDYSQGVFSKQCQVGNCTTALGQTQAPANCFNNSINTFATCCCYGDGCNASPSMFPLASSLFAVLIPAFLLS
ncbi:unnamed protein product [Caenorhabditis nigoni]